MEHRSWVSNTWLLSTRILIILAIVQSILCPAGAQPGFAGYGSSDISDLAPVVKGGKPSAILLIPVLDTSYKLDAIAQQVQGTATDGWEAALATLSREPFYPTVTLRRILNAYSDNIYTTDSDRRNMYLDGSAMLGLGTSTFGFGTLSVGQGGAAPTSGETVTYLYRNEALTAVEALRDELRFLLAQRAKGVPEDPSDLVTYLETARRSLREYLAQLPPEDVAAARGYVANRLGVP